MATNGAVRGRINWVKWGLGCSGLGTLLVVGLIFAGLIVGPMLFRRLSPENQERLVRRLPFLSVWQPTSEFAGAVVPTLAATRADALALLASPTDSPTEAPVSTATHTPSLTPTQATETPTPLLSATAMHTSTATDTATLTATLTTTLTATLTATHTVTSTATATASETPIPPTTIPTEPPTDQPTNIAAQPIPSATTIPTETPAPTETLSPTLTETPTATPSATATATVLPTNTPRPTATATDTPSATPSSTPSNTPSSTPTEPPTLTPVPTLPPLPTAEPLPASVRLRGLTWEPQKFNNCGPANLVQVMRYFKWQDPQTLVAGTLKPTQDDKNVSPSELIGYVNGRTSLRAISRVAGSLDLVKRLVAHGFPPILETGFYDPAEPQEGWIGHYMTIIAYNDLESRMYRLDTLKNEQSDIYATIDELWAHFNREYIVVYPPEREAELAALIGPDWDAALNAQNALNQARAAAAQQPSSPFAWFNVGSSFVLTGQYNEAAIAYDQAFSVGDVPYRMLWYQFGPFEAYYQAGQYDRALSLIEFTLETSKQRVEEMFYYRGLVAAARGDKSAAMEDFKRALAFNANYQAAKDALNRVRG